MLFHVRHAMSEGRLSPSIFCSLHVMYDLDLLLNDKGRYIYFMNKYNVLQFQLDILMSSLPHTPPSRKGGLQMQSRC